MKWYYPREWTISFFRVVGMKVLTLLGIVLLIFGYTTPGLMMISSFFLEMIVGLQAITTIKKLAAYPKKRFGSSLVYLLLMPIAMSVISYNYITSAFTKEVIWCGRNYTKKEALSKKI
jgi:hypothetical protein